MTLAIDVAISGRFQSLVGHAVLTSQKVILGTVKYRAELALFILIIMREVANPMSAQFVSQKSRESPSLCSLSERESQGASEQAYHRNVTRNANFVTYRE